MAKDKVVFLTTETWAELWEMRKPGETFEDVIKRLIEFWKSYTSTRKT